MNPKAMPTTVSDGESYDEEDDDDNSLSDNSLSGIWGANWQRRRRRRRIDRGRTNGLNLAKRKPSWTSSQPHLSLLLMMILFLSSLLFTVFLLLLNSSFPISSFMFGSYPADVVSSSFVSPCPAPDRPLFGLRLLAWD